VSARVLLIDDIEANRKLIGAQLAHEYYTVRTAASGEEGISLARAEEPDIILLDVMMPGMDGYEVCRRLKTDEATRHVPIVFVSALDERVDRLKGLELGAEDFLTKPVNTAQLLARMRSLSRLKLVIDELRGREANGRRVGAIDGEAIRSSAAPRAHILLIDDNARQADRIARSLEAKHRVSLMTAGAGGGSPDLVIVSVAAQRFDGLKLVAHLRSSEATRNLPILAVCEQDDEPRALRSLDLGAHDLIYRPVDLEELGMRVDTLVRRYRYVQSLRNALDSSLELAVTDQLTGLHNRRYLLNQLQGHMGRAVRGGEPVSLITADIDFFKKINDTFGHDAGDEVLREFAARLAANFRPVDTAARMGGEEFVVAMPGTRGDYACLVAERLRRHVAGAPFKIRAGTEEIGVTVSLGVSTSAGAGDTVEALLKRADEALYRAKGAGRNRVMADAA
jgi:two-component system cell cycle response regulator